MVANVAEIRFGSLFLLEGAAAPWRQEASMAQAIQWQRIEALILFVSSVGLFWHWNETVPWWAALLLFLAPDVSFLGYLFGPKVGAFAYNTVHIYAFGAAFLAAGLIFPNDLLAVLGALWLAHAGFDRILGYGLKLPEGFSFTHLGRIGNRSKVGN